MPLATLLLVFIGVALSSGSQIILKLGMNQQDIQQTLAEGDSVAIALSVATSPLVILGFALFGLSAVLWLFVLSRTPLSSAYPFVALGITATVAAGAVFFGEAISYLKMSGVGLITVGILLVAIGG
jgi:multidrug transporter EmrE-like cation transporter